MRNIYVQIQSTHDITEAEKHDNKITVSIHLEQGNIEGQNS